ncbi:hypothetical protein G6F66_014537 [Rhizopus arrhizus]|nr:hypothetical protein G6F23_014063 [Rhizopus arrhizus]KAG1258850.1 hypothetical protein G6F66_014537 [Rhizopus arrhizus]
METHCFYCHKPGHTKATCLILESRKLKTCYGCQSPQHLFRDCPEQRSNKIGSKRPRVDAVTHREDNTTKARHSNEKQQGKPATFTIDNTIPEESKALTGSTVSSEELQDQVENHTSQAKTQDLHHKDNTTEVSVSRYEVSKTHNINLTHSMSTHENNYNCGIGVLFLSINKINNKSNNR